MPERWSMVIAETTAKVVEKCFDNHALPIVCHATASPSSMFTRTPGMDAVHLFHVMLTVLFLNVFVFLHALVSMQLAWSCMWCVVEQALHSLQPNSPLTLPCS
jgi:hypothetical protein